MLYGARDFALGSKQELHWRRRMGPNFLHPLLPHVDMPELLLFGGVLSPSFPLLLPWHKEQQMSEQKEWNCEIERETIYFLLLPNLLFSLLPHPPPSFPTSSFFHISPPLRHADNPHRLLSSGVFRRRRRRRRLQRRDRAIPPPPSLLLLPLRSENKVVL